MTIKTNFWIGFSRLECPINMAEASFIRYKYRVFRCSTWISFVFVTAINLLTLLAFSVHAVFGCCVHHQHDSHSESCHTVKQAVDCGHSHIAKVDNNHDSVKHNGCCHDEHSSTASELSVGHESQSAPCDGSHDCKEPRCNFVAAAPETLDVLGSGSLMIAHVGDQLTFYQFSLSARSSCQRYFEAASPHSGALIYCALLQSWQI